MLLASFISGLSGEVGKFTGFNLPSNMSEALKIATTVNQAQTEDRRHENFYVHEQRTRRQSGRASQEQRRNTDMKGADQHAEASCTQRQNRQGPPQEIQETVRT
jgi:hypothetical protein